MTQTFDSVKVYSENWNVKDILNKIIRGSGLPPETSKHSQTHVDR